MTATIVDAGTPGLHWSGDTATYNDAIHIDGQQPRAVSRVHVGILWDDRSLGERIDAGAYVQTDAVHHSTRRSVASGTTLVVPGETPVTVAEHDTSRFSDGEYGVERYLI